VQDIPLGENILGRDPNGHVGRVLRVFLQVALGYGLMEINAEGKHIDFHRFLILL